jgi:hypothetical protein
MVDEYRTSIPPSVDERVTETGPDRGKRRVEYLLGGIVVAPRDFFAGGNLEDEWALPGDDYHGMHYR